MLPILNTLCSMQPHFESKERKDSKNPFLKLLKVFSKKEEVDELDIALENAQWEFTLKKHIQIQD